MPGYGEDESVLWEERTCDDAAWLVRNAIGRGALVVQVQHGESAARRMNETESVL
jgi:hypothetical protein